MDFFGSPSRQLIEELKRLHGLPPYDEASNTSRGDGYFDKSIRGRFSSEEVLAAEQELGIMPKPKPKRTKKALYTVKGEVRRCSRCHKEDAVQRVKSEWLGPLCLQSRRRRQEQTAAFVPNKCECGTIIGRHVTECDTCEQARHKNELHAQMIDRVEQCNSLEDIKTVLLDILEKLND